jgi:hypothetical protein
MIYLRDAMLTAHQARELSHLGFILVLVCVGLAYDHYKVYVKREDK